MSKSIGTILKLARVAQGLKQQELSKLSGVSQSLITKIENGRVRNPRPKVRLALSQALQQSPELLLVSEDDITQQEEKERLVSMLVRCGVYPEAALLIVNSIRRRSRKKVIDTLTNIEEEKYHVSEVRGKSPV